MRRISSQFSSQFSDISFQRRLLPLALLIVALIGVASIALAPLVGAQNGQQPAAPATNSSAADTSAPPTKLTYPEAKKVDQVDDYFGTKVPDPYRWLENNDSPEVAAWVEAENKVTFAYLDKIPYRSQLKDRLTKLLNSPKYTAPSRRGEWFVFSKNDGLQNQNVYYIQKGLDATPELLLDPNKFSADGTSRLGALSWSPKGNYVLYGISQGGSDWNDLYVLDVASKKPLSDHLQWI